MSRERVLEIPTGRPARWREKARSQQMSESECSPFLRFGASVFRLSNAQHWLDLTFKWRKPEFGRKARRDIYCIDNQGAAMIISDAT